MLDAWLRSRGAIRSGSTDPGSCGGSDWLFPNALKVPGPLPILGNANKDTCSRLAWFPKWLCAAEDNA
eukprot:12924291-Prorocentrum_lima.AAC.1